MGLGSCEYITLAEAWEKAREVHKKIMDGINPIEERRAMKTRARLEAAKTKTFSKCAETFIMTVSFSSLTTIRHHKRR